MATTNEERAQPRPALVLLYAKEDRRWPLEREVVTLGRARGCDVALEAADVSSLHTVIWRNSAGFQLRDCGSRAGTHVNGDRVTQATLHDGDILQVGPFSFKVSLPKTEMSARELRLRHVERSRRNLARLALALRQRRQREAPAEGVAQSTTTWRNQDEPSSRRTCC
jgi:pSer/pThr/pTyr-binding forkhead associated (FHA) protein